MPTRVSGRGASRASRAVAAALAVAAFAGCGTTPGATPAGATATNGGPSTASGGGTALGFDCATLLTAAELDAAAGLEGGTVSTTRRGDQPGEGDVPGVTACAIEIPSAEMWFGHFNVYAGTEAIDAFDGPWDFAKGQGAGDLAGVGTQALLQSDDIGVNGWARDGGAAVEVGVAWDSSSTTEDAVKDAVRQILVTVLART